MIIKKKRKGVPEEPVQKKKKVKSSKSQTVIEIGKGDIGTEDDDQLEIQTKVWKKEKLKEDGCLDQLELKKKKKMKNKKKKVGSKLLKEAHSESFVSIESCLDSEPREESEEQIKIFKKKKKKVQCHSLSLENNQSNDVELPNHPTGGTEENEFAFRQSRQNTALSLELDGEVTKKKKKGIFSFSLEDSEHKQCEKVHKKTHRYISPEKAFTGESHGTEIIQNDGESYVKKKKKKKKDKSDSFLPLTGDQDDISGVPNSPVVLSDFRKRQRKNSQEITWTNTEEEDSTGNTGSIREPKRKKRRKEVCSLPWEGDGRCRHRAPGQQLPAQEESESEEKELSGKRSRRNIKNNNEVIEKKKKVQKEEEETTYAKVSVNGASKSQKIMLLESKKKKKERGMKQAKCLTGDGGDQVSHNSNHVLCDRKRKRRKKVPQDFAEEPGSKANTPKIEREEVGGEELEHVDDITFVQEKKGNCDEVNIDKVRRQALQEEIDRESGKTKVSSPGAEGELRFGQWSTAAFQSPEQEMKFLRLMGGFKKGSAPPQNPATKALGRAGQDELQRNLELQFHRAMDLKQRRGIGLGFQPAAHKKAYIDKYASRSIKFED